jgi:thiosulfate reductase cytochrome b subunit
MKDTTKRSILRTIHMVFALPLIGYIYGPPSETVQYLPYFRLIYFPLVALSGLWMWKGHAIRGIFSRSS